MQSLKKYVRENSTLLFKQSDENEGDILFDSKGFFFSNAAQNMYDLIKNQPHIYVAWSSNDIGNYYIGKSFQKGGRWKRSHAYHLGTLAHHLLDTINKYDQNHAHWIEKWMDISSLKLMDSEHHLIKLYNPIYICFIPFSQYSNLNFNLLTAVDVKSINTQIEKQLIQSYLDDNINLLNIQNV